MKCGAAGAALQSEKDEQYDKDYHIKAIDDMFEV